MGQGIHQPGLPLGQIKGSLHSLRGKDLSCFGSVLLVEVCHIRPGKVAQGQGLHLNVENVEGT